MKSQPNTIAVIGAGNMGEALMRGLVAQRVFPPQQITAVDLRAERLQELEQALGVRTATAVHAADVFILAVKPQQINDVLGPLAGRLTAGGLVVSIAAGITTARLETALGGQPRVVRVMPNTPALVGAGIAGLCAGRYATAEDLELAETILRAVGQVVRVPEELMDAVTAVSGSGPAYVFFLAEAMIQAGEQAGLAPDVARQLAIQTVIGAGRLLAESGDAPDVLRQKVTSPGGTTAAALAVLTEKGFASIVSEAIAAAEERGRALADG